ncbi:dnaJ [Symbiodinium microadriaticum]|nr:dnaJ [Symbiodinium microadriaticum]
MPLADAYETLGLRRSCSDEEIKQAYRALALKNHPDKVQDETRRRLATVRFQEIQAAYEIIIETRTRTFSLAAVAPASRTALMAACERWDPRRRSGLSQQPSGSCRRPHGTGCHGALCHSLRCLCSQPSGSETAVGACR